MHQGTVVLMTRSIDTVKSCVTYKSTLGESCLSHTSLLLLLPFLSNQRGWVKGQI